MYGIYCTAYVHVIAISEIFSQEPYLTTMPVWHTTSENESTREVIERVATLNLDTNYKVGLSFKIAFVYLLLYKQSAQHFSNHFLF